MHGVSHKIVSPFLFTMNPLVGRRFLKTMESELASKGGGGAVIPSSSASILLMAKSHAFSALMNFVPSGESLPGTKMASLPPFTLH